MKGNRIPWAQETHMSKNHLWNWAICEEPNWEQT